MRTRIPVVLALALFVAVSCDQQPTQPLEQDGSAVPALFGANGAVVVNDYLEFGFPLCGYTYVDCQMKLHDIERVGDDGSGGQHYTWKQTLHGTCSSEETSEEWRVTNDWHEQSQSQASGQDEGTLQYISAGVGKGHAPNFKARIRCQYVVNANGVPVVDRCTEFICEEFGN